MNQQFRDRANDNVSEEILVKNHCNFREMLPLIYSQKLLCIDFSEKEKNLGE